MKIADYIKKEIVNVKKMPRKERWEYFWEYYKWHAIITLVVIAILVQGVVGRLTRKDIVFSGFVVNSIINVQDEAFLQGFYDCAGIDAETQEAAIYTDLVITDRNSQTDITAFQRIVAGIASEDTDFVVGTPEAYHICAYSTARIFKDLRDFLDADALARHEDKLYYIDGAVIEILRADPSSVIDFTQLEYPDPTKPETMEDPIPVGIDISNCADFQAAYYFPNTTFYLGVTATAPHADLTQQFIRYLFAE